MSYSDQKFYSRAVRRMVSAGSYGTATASATNGCNGAGPTLPKLIRRSAVTAVQVRVTTIPDTGSTGAVLQFLNGTNTFATLAVTTASANQVLAGTINTAYNVFDADAQPTTKITGTATASGAANGAYDVDFELQEAYA